MRLTFGCPTEAAPSSRACTSREARGNGTPVRRLGTRKPRGSGSSRADTRCALRPATATLRNRAPCRRRTARAGYSSSRDDRESRATSGCREGSTTSRPSRSMRCPSRERRPELGSSLTRRCVGQPAASTRACATISTPNPAATSWASRSATAATGRERSWPARLSRAPVVRAGRNRRAGVSGASDDAA